MNSEYAELRVEREGECKREEGSLVTPIDAENA